MKINNIIRMIAVALMLPCIMLAYQGSRAADQAESVIARTISLPAFDAIHNNCGVKLHINQGNRQSVRVKESNGRRLKLSVSGKTLLLDVAKSIDNTGKSAEVWITIPALKSVINDGALEAEVGNIKGKELSIINNGALTLSANKLSFGRLKYKNYGAITEDITLNCKELYLENSGSWKTLLTLSGNNILSLNNDGAYECDVRMSGAGTSVTVDNSGIMKGELKLQADSFTFNNNGSGKQDISFKGDEMNIDNSGAVNVDLYVDCKKLKAKSSGVSSLTVSGTADDTTIDSDGVSKIDSSKLNRF